MKLYLHLINNESAYKNCAIFNSLADEYDGQCRINYNHIDFQSDKLMCLINTNYVEDHLQLVIYERDSENMTVVAKINLNDIDAIYHLE